MNNTPKQNEEKIKGINDSFLSALDDFKQYYVFYNKNPEVDEYSNNFENSKNQLQSLSGEMYTITNNIQKNSTTYNFGLHFNCGLNKQPNPPDSNNFPPCFIYTIQLFIIQIIY